MNIDLQPKDNVSKPQIEAVEREKQEYTLLGKIKRTRGLRLFEFDPKTQSLTEVEVGKVGKIVFSDMNTPNPSYYKATVDTRRVYFEALNLKSATKRLNRFLNGKIKRLSNIRKAGEIKLY